MLSQLEGSLNFGGNKSMETVVIKSHSKPPARATLMLTWKKEILSNILPTPFIVRESERRKSGPVCHSNISTTYW